MIGLYARAAVIAGALAVLSGAYMAGRTHGKAAVQLKWDAAVSVQRQAALDAEQEARRIEAERATKAQEIVTHAQAQVRAARRAAAAASAAAGGLRDAARAAADRCSAVDPAPVGRSQANVLADALADLAEQGGRVAAEADAAVIAGQACEAAYSSLTEPKP